jgi:hypothetical protein
VTIKNPILRGVVAVATAVVLFAAYAVALVAIAIALVAVVWLFPRIASFDYSTIQGVIGVVLALFMVVGLASVIYDDLRPTPKEPKP